MSENPEFDPFATDADPFQGADNNPFADDADPFDSLDLGDLDFSEEESSKAVRVRDDRKTYEDPRDVGLQDGMWIPIQIESAVVAEKHVSRMRPKSCVAVEEVVDPATGEKKRKIHVVYDDIKDALRRGASERIDEFPLPHFVCSANHIVPAYGRRRYDYDIEAPVVTIKSARREPKNGNTGFPNEDGRTLRLATGATRPGDTVTKENMHDIAQRMVDTVVMARVSLVQSKRARQRTRLDENKKPISVLVDPQDASPVEIVKDEDGNLSYAESGEVWTGDESLLVPLPSGKYAIRDDSDSSDVLREAYYPVNDYINAPFLPVPERKVTVERLDGTQVEGEITWETVGAIAAHKAPGVMVDVMLKGGGGEIVSAVWLGGEWSEVPAQGGALDEFKGDDLSSFRAEIPAPASVEGQSDAVSTGEVSADEGTFAG